MTTLSEHCVARKRLPGHIQTPGWTEEKSYAVMDSCKTIKAPPFHYIMISFLTVQLGAGWVQMFPNQSCSSQVRMSSLGKNPSFQQRLFRTTMLSVRFTSEYGDERLRHGFRLSFSFHNMSALPQQLPGGMWNCSVPYWADLQQHFLCTLEPECAGGEDELICPWQDAWQSMCGTKFRPSATKCFAFFRSSRPHFWNKAKNWCLHHGFHLPQVKTAEDLEDLNRLCLRHRDFDVDRFYLGLKTPSEALYRKLLQTTDEGIISYEGIFPEATNQPRKLPVCALLIIDGLNQDLNLITCAAESYEKTHILCESDEKSDGSTDSFVNNHVISLSTPSVALGSEFISCPANHSTRNFLACDLHTACWYDEIDGCLASLTPLPPSFLCYNEIQNVPFALVCDYRKDCDDGSDEKFCVFKGCTALDSVCKNGECIPTRYICDQLIDCADSSDEIGGHCPEEEVSFSRRLQPPAVVSLDGYGGVNVTQLDPNSSCPETHFQCPGDGYCLPVYVRCNGMNDCPGKEDEAACDSYTCPGFYRCRKSAICLHPNHICDNIFQCPLHDDDILCQLTCPDSCVCYGTAFMCAMSFSASQYRDLRYLDARGSGMTTGDVANNSMLVHLSLAECNLTHIDILHLSNLHSLDLSDNHLTTVSRAHLGNLNKLQALYLSRNPLVSIFSASMCGTLKTLDLAGVVIAEINLTSMAPFPNIETLNLSGSRLEYVLGKGFQPLKELKVLDLRGCPMTVFPKDVFKDLRKLQTVYADNYKICCSATLPEDFNVNSCYAPSDVISSCEDLLRSDLFRVCLAIFACLALIGNLSSFVFRTFSKKPANNMGFSVFVTHLCVSDFLMGVYLAVIGMADQMYRGNYLWEDQTWKMSVACKTAGFLSLMSSEVSAFIICLITVDRFLVIRFTFSTVRFEKRSAHTACSIVWILGACLAIAPLLPMTSHWQFYGQTGICIPLPITKNSFHGHTYSFGVMIVLNFVLFLLIAVGQIVIYWSIQTNSMSTADSTRRSRDMAIARRLFAIVISDFTCWFPVGLLGVMASSGLPVSGGINVAMAIFFLPFNSAVNPFLYTFNIIMEKRREKRTDQLRRRLIQEIRNAGNRK